MEFKGKAYQSCLFCMGVVEIEKQIINELTNTALEMMSDWPSSREKQRQFVLAYIASGFRNATEAARKAGYSEKTAKQLSNRLLTYVDFFHVQEVIQKIKILFDKRSTELSIATAVEIKQFHTAVMRGQVQDTELITLDDGSQQVVEIPARLKERQKSADSLTKMIDKLSDEKRQLEIELLKSKLAPDDEDEMAITGFTFDRSEYNGDTEPSEAD